MLLMLVSACANVPNVSSGKDAATCDALSAIIDELNNAALVDAGDQTLLAVDKLIVAYDAACLQS